MLSFVLLFAVWPFHHKKPAAVSEATVVNTEPVACSKEGDLYFYAGDDKMIGISTASCVDAYVNWQHTHIDPVRMSRA